MMELTQAAYSVAETVGQRDRSSGDRRAVPMEMRLAAHWVDDLVDEMDKKKAALLASTTDASSAGH